MRWLDVAGPPGVGKSTLTDDLWPPRCIQWDGKPYPEEWGEFLEVVEWLFSRIEGHPSYRTCESMVHRLFKKMATVQRMNDPRVYIQTGFAQRALGFGWRLKDPNDLTDYYRLMPVSCGVVFLTAPVEEVQRRNVERGKDRSHMVPLMEEPREIGVRVLRERGVDVRVMDTTLPVEQNVKALIEFANRTPNAGAAGHRREVAVPAASA